MKKNRKRMLIKCVVGIAGLAAAFILGRWISTNWYQWQNKSQENQQPQTGDDSLPPPQAALTEEELEALFRSAKEQAMTLGQSQSAEGKDSGEEKDFGEGKDSGEEKSPSGGELTSPEEGEDESSEDPDETDAAIDFEYLKTLNEDIYAWITIPGTNIDYPILRHPTDNSFYLNHNLDGSYGYPGCIYTEDLNSKDFTDPNTLIYGHNLKSKTMFTELHKFENKDFFDSNDQVIIYLPDKTLYYKIFAVHVYDDRHVLYSFDFTDQDIYESYLQSIYDIRDMNANINRDFTVTGEDKIITLSTCMPNKSDADKRLHVHAVLQEE